MMLFQSIVKSYSSQCIYDEKLTTSGEMTEVTFDLITVIIIVIIMISMIRVDVKMPLDICLASHAPAVTYIQIVWLCPTINL